MNAQNVLKISGTVQISFTGNCNNLFKMAESLKHLKESFIFSIFLLARRLRAKFWPDCAIPDTSMKFGTVVDHD